MGKRPPKAARTWAAHTGRHRASGGALGPALAIALATCLCANGWAQDYPRRAVRLIVPFAPGGGTDIVSRLIAQQLSAVFSQSVIVDNRTGGGTTIGTGIAASAAPDGHTLVMVASTFAADAALLPGLAYHPVRSFTPVARVTEFPFVLVAHPSLPAKSIQELIDLARARPGSLNYASGSGSAPARLGMELFKWLARVDIVGIPYKGAGPAVTALLGGETQLLFSTLPGVLPHVKAGRMRALALSAATRHHVVPDLPTIAEGGVNGYAFASWHGLLAPAQTPQDVVARINTEVNRIMSGEQARERLAALGLDAVNSSPSAFREVVAEETRKWAALVKQTGLSAN